MSLILARSPYFVDRGGYSESATLTLEIGKKYQAGGLFLLKTYNLVFRNSLSIDISPFIRDYLSFEDLLAIRKILYVRITISGVSSSDGSALPDTINEHFATDGYLYSTDDYDEDMTDTLEKNCWFARSSNIVYKLDDEPMSYSFFQPKPKLLQSEIYDEDLTASFWKGGELVYTVSPKFLNGQDGGSLSIFNDFGLNAAFGYKGRVIREGGVYEETKCIEGFLDDVKIVDYDRIQLVTDKYSQNIEVKTFSECKYKPYKVSFANRYGLFEDLWFFKRSDLSMSVSKETYRGNSLDRVRNYKSIKTINHFNVNGQEKLTLNSGFVDERMNETFKQLLLSEEVNLYDTSTSKIYSVNLGTSEFQHKQHVNDKLINYSIEFEFAHEIINNIG